MITRNFNLYLNAGHSVPLVINVNQYDSGEQWVFTLYNADGTQYTPSTGAIVGIKSDGLGIINSGSVVNGKVVINETQQMTAAVGKAVFELLIDSQTHGTANFVVLVEEKPGNNADLSESDISMIEQAIEAASTIKPYGSPLVASTVAGMTDHDKVYVYVGSETGYTSGNWYYWDGSAWTSGGVYNSVAVQTDTTLTLSGVAADAKKTGDEITDLKSAIQSGGGFNAEVKTLLESLFGKLGGWLSDPTQDLNALHNAFFPPANLDSITAVYTQGGTVYDTDTLDSLKSDLVVTAHFSDSTSETVSSYTLSGVLTEGTSTITVSYGGKSTTFTVTVSSTAREAFEFENGYSVAVNGSTHIATKTAATARATTATPIPNLGYVFTSTDQTKYQVNAIDVTQFKQPNNNGYPTGGKTITWGETDSANTAFVWLALKKVDGTDFTTEELANGASAVFTFTKTNFGTFANGYTAIKTSGSGSINYRKATAARATTPIPVANNNYVVTVTDSTKYNLLIHGVQSLEKVTNAQSADTYGFTSADSTAKSWATQDTSSAPYIWICLKKMDGTAFTDAELANDAEAVFTYTEG